MDFAEHQILPEEEKSFNLSVFYGKDADWASVVNACRRYPMFAERQVVLLKEAQQMRDIVKLEPYILQPLGSTIFVVSYNDFELQAALVRKDLSKALRIIQYFESNPKAAPIQLVLPALYSFFSKVYMIFGIPDRDEKMAAVALGVSPFFVKDYLLAAKNYGFTGTENALLLLHQYNLKSVGVGSVNVEDASLLKELVVKII